MVMGPSCGMMLADLGADVIKIEPAPAGDNTRRLTGPAIGFFPTFNRNKRSLVRRPEAAGRAGAGARSSPPTADVLIENFRPGAMDKLGLGYAAMAEVNPRLVYCSCKGFLPGPYEHRTALDEVVQMMGGLAYMTGPPGKPLRAGSSVNDIMGGMFAAIAHPWPRCASASGPAAAAWCSPACSRPAWCWWRSTWRSAAIEGREPADLRRPGHGQALAGLRHLRHRRSRASRCSSAWSPRPSGASFCEAFGLHAPARGPGPADTEAARRGAAAHPAARRRRPSASCPRPS